MPRNKHYQATYGIYDMARITVLLLNCIEALGMIELS
jgi:hypothetical protein